ncbi:alpha/beta hydrolase [Algibacter sp. 2305UL17-15]|uniref:alpha/beta hydrolase n=1 Tax=Algibacter sp. 2305UL17-15 TaxID=3231268 RepID=UPI0034598514
MMQKLFIYIALLFVMPMFSQNDTYDTVEGLHYYNDSITNADAYVKKMCQLDIYYPKNKTDAPTVVWFHGGGLSGGDKFIPEALKNNGMIVVAVNYRLSPIVKNPKYIEDAAASVAWVFNNIERYNGIKKSIFVSGHSAGGYLASMVGLDKKWLQKHDIDADDIAGLIPFSGHTITHFTIRKEQGIAGTQPIIDEFAPLYHVRKDAPPILIITGDREKELLGRYEENAYFMRMLKVVGHKNTTLYELDGYNHSSMAEPAFQLLINFVKNIHHESKND